MLKTAKILHAKRKIVFYIEIKDNITILVMYEERRIVRYQINNSIKGTRPATYEMTFNRNSSGFKPNYIKR